MKKLVLLSLAAAIMLTGCSSKVKNLKPEQAKERAEKFINAALMRPGTQATVKEIEEANGFYKMKIDVGSGDPIDSYLSRDGKLFFPQAMDIDEVNKQIAGESNTSTASTSETATVSKKSDKPVIELFVMSYCPYGLQMERGILPVVEKLAGKVDFKLRFCDYAMHEKPEVDENLTQYCIQKEQPEKFTKYLRCFIKDGQAAPCYKEAGIDEQSLKSCVSQADKQYKITESYNNKDSWNGQFPPFSINKAENEKYGVQGSPFLVINGQEISSGRDSASLLKSVCSAFNNSPEECKAELSSESPAAGFASQNNGNASGSCN
ncbi:MAG TPA: thioredoxin domain-containing protein [bacterium]|nr:thioredoxin domain-containing protein [bacterium]